MRLNAAVTIHGVTLPDTNADMCGPRISEGDCRTVDPGILERRVALRAAVLNLISEMECRGAGSTAPRHPGEYPNPAGADFFALAPPGPTKPCLLFAGGLNAQQERSRACRCLGSGPADSAAGASVDCRPGARRRLCTTRSGPVNALDLQESVEIVGLVDNDRMRREIVNARTVVLFSRQENAPTILAQAMAAGKPVVASRVGGVGEMVDDAETGFLVDPGRRCPCRTHRETARGPGTRPAHGFTSPRGRNGPLFSLGSGGYDC